MPQEPELCLAVSGMMFLWPENGDEPMEVIEVILGCTRLTRTDSMIFKELKYNSEIIIL